MSVREGEVVWRKSSRSANNGLCVEVALSAATAAVRDSKDPEGPALRVGAAEWGRFLAGVKRCAFDSGFAG